MTRTRMIADVEAADFPSAEFRFFIYDPEGHGFLYFRTAEDRDTAAPDVIRDYCDDGWSEEVESVIAGEITHTCQKTNVEQRPEVVDEEGYDGEGNYWAEEWDFKCDYALVGIQQAEQEQQP
jgi:hypothetical protein